MSKNSNHLQCSLFGCDLLRWLWHCKRSKRLTSQSRWSQNGRRHASVFPPLSESLQPCPTIENDSKAAERDKRTTCRRLVLWKSRMQTPEQLSAIELTLATGFCPQSSEIGLLSTLLHLVRHLGLVATRILTSSQRLSASLRSQPENLFHAQHAPGERSTGNDRHREIQQGYKLRLARDMIPFIGRNTRTCNSGP